MQLHGAFLLRAFRSFTHGYHQSPFPAQPNI